MEASIGINGFGRVGRAVFRAAHERGLELEWLGINDLADTETLAHLLKYDSVYGRFPGDVTAGGDFIAVDGTQIPVYNEAEPGALPWGEAGAEIVIERGASARSSPR